MLQNALHAASAVKVLKAKRAAGVLRLSLGCAMACFTLGAIQAAHAQAAAAAAPATWASTIKYSGELDGGIAGNFASPGNEVNFGQSSTDTSNKPTLNALFLTVERDPNTSTTTFDWGFKVQGEYGSDVRYNRYYGEFNHQDTRYMGEITQAYLTAHGAGLFSGGYDLTLGQFLSPLGDEVIDPRTNPFYSHSYLFSYGVPTAATGGYAVIHPAIADFYLGADTGINTTIGTGNAGDSSPSYLVGTGKSVGNWTLLLLSHFGPAPFEGNKKYRTYIDTVDAYKVNSNLTLTTELDYVHDELYNATAYGAAEYAAYTLSPTVTLNGRIEAFDDEKSFFVGSPLADNAVITGSPYLFAPKAATGGDTTYGEITVGVTYAPANLPGLLSTLEIRPEFRVDDALNGGSPFDTNKAGVDGKSTQETLSADANLTF